jgi:hypothetical protein
MRELHDHFSRNGTPPQPRRETSYYYRAKTCFPCTFFTAHRSPVTDHRSPNTLVADKDCAWCSVDAFLLFAFRSLLSAFRSLLSAFRRSGGPTVATTVGRSAIARKPRAPGRITAVCAWGRDVRRRLSCPFRILPMILLHIILPHPLCNQRS